MALVLGPENPLCLLIRHTLQAARTTKPGLLTWTDVDAGLIPDRPS